MFVMIGHHCCWPTHARRTNHANPIETDKNQTSKFNMKSESKRYLITFFFVSFRSVAWVTWIAAAFFLFLLLLLFFFLIFCFVFVSVWSSWCLWPVRVPFSFSLNESDTFFVVVVFRCWFSVFHVNRFGWSILVVVTFARAVVCFSPLHSMHMLSWLQLSEMANSSASSRGFSDPICCPLGHAIQRICLMAWTSANKQKINNNNIRIWIYRIGLVVGEKWRDCLFI